MNSAESVQRFKRISSISLGFAGVALCAWFMIDALRVRINAHRLASSDPGVRQRALRTIGGDRDVRAASAVFAVIERETDRDLLEKAGYTAMRLRDVRAVPFLRKRAATGPDDIIRAKLLMYAARVSNRDWRLTDWLQAGTASSEHWLRAGSALALLELGRVEGGESLIKMAPELDPAVRDWALKQFREFADAMAQTTGFRIEGWDKEDSPAPSESEMARYQLFWRQYASAQLLADVLYRRERVDDQWHHVNRLLHAQERLAEWLN